MEALMALRQSTGMSRCLDCGKCTTLCPLVETGVVSARRIAAHDAEDEEIRDRGAGLRHCLTCGACETRCPQGVRFTEFVRGLRDRIAPGARGPCPHAGVFQSIARSMAGPAAPGRSNAWIGSDLQIAEEGEVALFVGCLPFFEIYFGDDLGIRPLEIARAAIRILNRDGIKPVVLDQERCCGHDLLWGGDRPTFEALARANSDAFSSRGVKRILTTCAECCRTWRLDYPEVVPGYRPKVEHLAEFVAERLEAGALKFRSNGSATLTYQDPCRLGRHLGVIDAPRRVLSALPGARLVEMDRTGRDAVCCGTSGFIHCDAASRCLQGARLREAAATGAGTIVTACPKCLTHFECAQAEDRRRGNREKTIEVRDFAIVADSGLETRDRAAGGGAAREESKPGGQR